MQWKGCTSPVGPGRVGNAGRALQLERLAILFGVMDIAQFSNPNPNLQKDIMLFFLMGWGNFKASTENIKRNKISAEKTQ